MIMPEMVKNNPSQSGSLLATMQHSPLFKDKWS